MSGSALSDPGPGWLADGHFNHNDHYHGFLLRHVPASCARALDGCGSGAFARLLATRRTEVDAIDRDPGMITVASGPPNVHFVHADIRDHDLGDYDFVSCVASLHHVPFARDGAQAP